MQHKIKQSPILDEYHNGRLKEHKLFLKLLLSEERSQNNLRKLYDATPPEKKKKKDKLKRKLKKRKPGHQRKCFDMETARNIVRAEGIMSSAQYDRWYEMNRPVRMPRNPERSYKSTWTGWGDFLGVYNTYIRRPGDKTNGRGKYRSFESARMFARSLNFKKIQQWREYTRSGLCPTDIPHRPDLVYTSGKRKEYWLSWKDFLGYDIVNTMQKIQDVAPVLYIAKSLHSTNKNIYIINVIPGGKDALEDHIKKINAKVISAYYTNGKFDHNAWLNELPKYAYGGIDEYMLNNIFEYLEPLEENLEIVR